MAVVPFSPYTVYARRVEREAKARAEAAAREQARQRARLPEAPPPVPKLRVNLSPSAATRTLAALGLGVAVCATVAATLSLVTTHAGVGVQVTAPTLSRLTAWLASMPWLFLAVTLFAISRIEAVVHRTDGRVWTGLCVSAAALAAWQATGGVIVDGVSPIVRVGGFVTLVGAAGLLLRDFCSAESGAVRLQIVGGLTGGLAVAVGPFVLIGQALLPATERSVALSAMLAGCDALLGLVVATLTVHATLIYVRDFLPDFTIALDTADQPAASTRKGA
jgi:hypothetical protein